MFLTICVPQIILILIAPVIIFFIGYAVGKKSGLIKRDKESKNQSKQLN